MKALHCAVFAIAVWLPSLAAAGPLSQTARGVDNAQDTHDDSGDSSRDHSSSDDDSSSRSSYDDDDYYDDDDDYYVSDCSFNCGSTDSDAAIAIGSALTTDPEGSLDLSLQDVRDSDGAVHVAGEIGSRFIGFRAQYDHYFEHVEAKMRSDDVHIGLWQMALSAHIVRLGRWKGDLTFGVEGVSSSEFDPMLGLGVGAAAAYSVHPQADLEVRGTTGFFEDEIRVYEGNVGMRASLLRVAYRVMKFSVGPAVHGPEVGLALRF